MNALKRIELFAVWRYGLKKRNGYNNSSDIIAHHTHLFCHIVTLGLTRDFLHTSNYNRESAHIYWDKPKLCAEQYESGVCYFNIHLNDGTRLQHSVFLHNLCYRVCELQFFICLRMQVFSCCAGNIRPVVRFEPWSFLLRSTCNLPSVLSVFPQYAFSYCQEWNMLLENLTRICAFGTSVWIRDDTRSSCIRRMLYMKSA
jgi:hypothetical protein